MTALERLRLIQPGEILSADAIYDAIFAAGSTLNDGDREAENALEIAIRLLDARKNGQVPDDAIQPIEFLVEECGLYPYVDLESFGLLTQTVIEAHAVTLEDKRYLHSKQMQVLLWLLQGDNVVLSAPTSFGKSLLVDAFLERKHPRTVVVILPTIALIDETRRRYQKTFGSQYRIITNVSDDYTPAYPTIFVLTQERFLQRKDSVPIDFLFIDEFYKLDPDRGDSRFETLNIAIYRALPLARQCFMAGPHIRSIEFGPRWSGNFRFVRTDYRTVTVNVNDRTASESLPDAFLTDLRSVGASNALVFTATPNTAQTLLRELVAADFSYETRLGPLISSWIQKNYHPEWHIAAGNERGIAVHHGRLPRALGQLFVHLFNDNEIKVLICTSTLIEGVNTSAANVFIYDKKINRSDFDFFSFANIRGRVGRMMRHFIGNVFLYHEPPDEVETSVTVPILNDPGTSTDYVLMNVDHSELSSRGQERQSNLPQTTGIEANIIRDHGALGVDLLVALKDRISQILETQPSRLIWSGFPDSEQRKTLAELCLLIAQRKQVQTGIHTAPMVAWAWSQLQRIRTLPKFLRWFSGVWFATNKAAGVDAAFQFLQASEFSFPRTLAAAEALVVQLRPDASVSYGPYITAMENWFRPAWMKELDEAGIPLPLAERLASYLRSPSNREDAINQIRSLNVNDLDQLDLVDRFVLSFALS